MHPSLRRCTAPHGAVILDDRLLPGIIHRYTIASAGQNAGVRSALAGL